MEQAFHFRGNDGVEIAAKKWSKDSTPLAIIQIAHGMAEHIQRYEPFAKRLVENNFFVYGNDHRGHGLTVVNKNDRGYFADEQGFDQVVEDMYILTTEIKKAHPHVPIILFGHSMGSLLSRRYIQKYGTELAGVIISGTSGDPGLLGKIGMMIAKFEVKTKGARTPSPLLNQLLFGSFNKKFKPTRTNFDWLSRDEKEVDKYMDDPHCGEIFTTGFFLDLFHGIASIHDQQNMNSIPKNLPIYIFSGDKDPVGNQTKGVLNVYKGYQKMGIKDVSIKFYPEGRHEMLNETNREEVYEDIIKWIKDII